MSEAPVFVVTVEGASTGECYVPYVHPDADLDGLLNALTDFVATTRSRLLTVAEAEAKS